MGRLELKLSRAKNVGGIALSDDFRTAGGGLAEKKSSQLAIAYGSLSVLFAVEILTSWVVRQILDKPGLAR